MSGPLLLLGLELVDVTGGLVDDESLNEKDDEESLESLSDETRGLKGFGL